MSKLFSRFSKTPDRDGQRSRANSEVSAQPPKLTLTDDSTDSPVSIHASNSSPYANGLSPNVSLHRKVSSDVGHNRDSQHDFGVTGSKMRKMDRHSVSRMYARQSMSEDEFFNDDMPTPTHHKAATYAAATSYPTEGGGAELSSAQRLKQQYIDSKGATDLRSSEGGRESSDSHPAQLTSSPETSMDLTGNLQSIAGPPPPENGSLPRSETAKEPRTAWRRSSLKSLKNGRSATGGIAGALAASGMNLAHPGIPPPVPKTPPPPPVPPLPPSSQLSPPQATGMHRSPSQSSLISSGDEKASQPRNRHYQYKVHAPRSDDERDDEEEEEEEEDDDELLLNEELMPVTGFAVASSKRNADFHELFPQVPPDDYLIEDYGCALQKEILVQGRLYVSENHICFHANIFGWTTDEVIPFAEITSIEKKMTAIIIPNAIQITTPRAKYTFASFMGRDTAFDVIHNIWRLARPGSSAPGSVAGDFDDREPGTATSATGRKVTQCGCSKANQHYSLVAMDCIFPGTPEKIYNLMFASGFIKEFLRDNQKLIDIQMSDWVPGPGREGVPDGAILQRRMTYIKPLNNSLGPKQTRCELTDEVKHFDFDDWITVLTTTRTPDVPSGSAFSVMTRTCITWAGRGTAHVVATATVEWTGSSFIKGIINNASIEGQKEYHNSLEKAMRAYINEHKTEFVPPGLEAAEEEEEAEALRELALSPATQSTLELKKERDERWLQWALDTFNASMNVASQSFTGALELIGDAWEQSGGRGVLFAVIGLLVVTNIISFIAMSRGEGASNRADMRAAAREHFVSEAMRTLLEEMRAVNSRPPPPSWTTHQTWQEDLHEIKRTLDTIEERVRLAREAIEGIDTNKRTDL